MLQQLVSHQEMYGHAFISYELLSFEEMHGKQERKNQCKRNIMQ